MINKLINLANEMDQRGLQKEANYLDGVIRKLAADAFEGGSRFEDADETGRRVQHDAWKKAATKKLQETYDWFLYEVFPKMKEDPRNLNITTNKPYWFFLDYDPHAGRIMDMTNSVGMFIPSGTSFKSAYGNYLTRKSTTRTKLEQFIPYAADGKTLAQIYEILEAANDKVDGAVLMTSIAGEVDQPPPSPARTERRKQRSDRDRGEELSRIPTGSMGPHPL